MTIRVSPTVNPFEDDCSYSPLPIVEASPATTHVALSTANGCCSSPVSIMKPPLYASVSDDLELAVPRSSRTVSFIGDRGHSTSPPAPGVNLYHLVRAPTPLPTLQGLDLQIQHQQRLQQQNHSRVPFRGWDWFFLALFLLVECSALAVVFYAFSNDWFKVGGHRE